MNDIANWLGDNPWIVWVGIAVLLSCAELLNLDLVLLMFAIGALIAAAATGFGAALWLALLVFIVASVALLYLVRPAVVDKLHQGPTLVSGVEALVGSTGITLEPIDSHGGRAMLSSEVWTARSIDDTQSFVPGDEVMVVKIDGATAVVTRKEQP